MEVYGQARLRRSSNYQSRSETIEHGEYRLSLSSHFTRVLAINCPFTHFDMYQIKLPFRRSAGHALEVENGLSDSGHKASAARFACQTARTLQHPPGVQSGKRIDVATQCFVR